jgi:hypothetical protein
VHYNFQQPICPNYNLKVANAAHSCLFFNPTLFSRQVSKSTFSAGPRQKSNLSQQLIPVLSSIILLFSAFNSQALTAKTTRNVISGSAPYLTFDGGRTRAANVDDLLSITLPSGIRVTSSTNTSSATNPIQLQRNNVSAIDIGMVVPTNASSAPFSSAIVPYWRDDDGDGQNGGIIATGDITLSIVDRNGQPVGRDEVFTSACGNRKAPYKLTLSFSGGRLSTRYGFPKDGDVFSPRSVAYYINPKAGSAGVCFARPILRYGSSSDDSRYHGPSNIWNPDKGFLVQSTDPAHYDRNFPTTGAHNLYFDLAIEGVNANQLSWPEVTHSGITATMTPDPLGTSVRVKLMGPNESDAGSKPKLTSPATFELVGRDSSGRAVIKYGFRLKQWFVNRGTGIYTYPDSSSWCNSIGYSMPRVRDLTNAKCLGRFCQVLVGASPSSSGNHYQRRIGSGFLTEWGHMGNYTGAGFVGGNWTSDVDDGLQLIVGSGDGYTYRRDRRFTPYVVCASVLRP